MVSTPVKLLLKYVLANIIMASIVNDYSYHG